jgi:fructose-bisphosphate aldolase class 1
VNRSAVSLDALIGIIISLKIPKGLKNSLFSKLENVLHSLENYKIKAAIYQLRAFINFVEAQRGKKLSREEAKELMSTARSIIVSLKNM